MIILLILGIVVLLAGLYTVYTNKGLGADPRLRFGGKIAGIAGVSIIVLSFIVGSFAAVPAGHRGVVIRFSAVTGTVLQEGLEDSRRHRAPEAQIRGTARAAQGRPDIAQRRERDPHCSLAR